MSAKAIKGSENNWKLAGSSWAGAWKVFAGIGALGLVGAGAGYMSDPRRFAFSWVIAPCANLASTSPVSRPSNSRKGR